MFKLDANGVATVLHSFAGNRRDFNGAFYIYSDFPFLEGHNPRKFPFLCGRLTCLVQRRAAVRLLGG